DVLRVADPAGRPRRLLPSPFGLLHPQQPRSPALGRGPLPRAMQRERRDRRVERLAPAAVPVLRPREMLDRVPPLAQRQRDRRRAGAIAAGSTTFSGFARRSHAFDRSAASFMPAAISTRRAIYVASARPYVAGAPTMPPASTFHDPSRSCNRTSAAAASSN